MRRTEANQIFKEERTPIVGRRTTTTTEIIGAPHADNPRPLNILIGGAANRIAFNGEY